jgi:hypothetical protein
MSAKHLDPAKTVVARVGGPQKVSDITGRNIATVYRWMTEKARGGTEGVIPHDDAKKLLGHAETAGIDLVPADFFTARALDDVEVAA